MAWNIYVILLLSMTSITMSSTNLGVRFCGFFPLDPSLNDTTLFLICNSWPTFKALPSANHGWFFDTNITIGLWTLNDGSIKTTYDT